MEATLAVLALALRELVHGTLGWLPAEPRVDHKRILGAHAYDDARSLVKLQRRLGEPYAPDERLREALEPLRLALDPAEFEAAAYGEIKPAVEALARATARALDPLADEPELRILVQLAQRQERHRGELPQRFAPAAAPELGSARPGPVPALALVPRPSAPARDPYVEIGPGGDGLHAELNAALLAAERAARSTHERLDASADELADGAREVHDLLRRAAVLERDYEGHWGDQPVDLSAWPT